MLPSLQCSYFISKCLVPPVSKHCREELAILRHNCSFQCLAIFRQLSQKRSAFLLHRDRQPRIRKFFRGP